MAFQAMNHGLEARATSSPRIRATHNLKAEGAPSENTQKHPDPSGSGCWRCPMCYGCGSERRGWAVSVPSRFFYCFAQQRRFVGAEYEDSLLGEEVGPEFGGGGGATGG